LIDCAFANNGNPLTSKCFFPDEDYINLNFEKPANIFIERLMNDEFDLSYFSPLDYHKYLNCTNSSDTSQSRLAKVSL
jgi:hypothetical protein